MNVIYRPLEPADKAAIMSFLGRVPEFAPDEIPVAEEVLDACTGNPLTSGYYCLIAENDGRVAGYVCYGNTPLTKGNWEIYWIAVDPVSQGLGIGRELMRRAEAGIRSRGGWQVTLETSSTPLYDKTRRFYLKCGYAEITRIPDFYDRGDDLVMYFKKLDQASEDRQ
ncbi:GNAT family N-acetyltransferase [Dehalogenimonas sp. THU2]|uniref:GNAT family N-acetyltransferase n=1 Tax=Dehalogenimonas sp. THU2 TaxID=3151121 RepID=UPI0032187411